MITLYCKVCRGEKTLKNEYFECCRGTLTEKQCHKCDTHIKEMCNEGKNIKCNHCLGQGFIGFNKELWGLFD